MEYLWEDKEENAPAVQPRRKEICSWGRGMGGELLFTVEFVPHAYTA